MRTLEHSGSGQPADAFDTFLVVLYLLGIYLGVEIRLSAGTPVPTVLAGLAGAIMLLKHMHRLDEGQVGHLLVVIALFLATVLAASEVAYVGKRTTGLLQLSYSFIIGYGLYLTMLLCDRRSLARIFGWFCVAIIVGCALENYVAPFRALSDAVRGVIFDFGVYAADRRDVLLYGQVRPKLFTSEPSAVTFGFVLLAFCWYVLSEWRWKLVAYGAMFAAAFLLIRGPTLLLGLLLLVPYELFLAPRRETANGVDYDMGRGTLAVSLAIILAGVVLVVGFNFYAERIEAIREGTDPSFFSRVTAPFLVAVEVIREKPLAGIGLTAESLIDGLVSQIYAQSGGLVSQYSFQSAKYALTNYFWTHWIYFGLIWGLVILVGLSFYLRSLQAPSILFCWSMWAVLGQASGAYVSPKTWTVLYLACVISILHQRATLSGRFAASEDGAAMPGMMSATPTEWRRT
ncbi:hypothetical protein [Thalassobaculum sp.]|uniref:hypothetical protein n=1 Tax=Thalassobaculum sp. TaxID=2022740 RepID=UPI0032ED16BA